MDQVWEGNALEIVASANVDMQIQTQSGDDSLVQQLDYQVCL